MRVTWRVARHWARGTAGAGRATRAGRALARYSAARGALLAGGMAYTALFSVFAALAIGVTVLMALLREHRELRASVLATASDLLPGVLDDGSGSGLLSIDRLTLSSALNPASVVAGAVLLYSATGLVGSLKRGVRAMFGLTAAPHSVVTGQLVNLVGFLGLLVAVLVTALASVVTGALGSWASDLPPALARLAGPGAWTTAALASLVIDACAFAGLVRLSGVRVPRRDLLLGSGAAAVGLGVLRVAGAGAVGGVVRNPLLASAAALVALVAWLHLASRLVLLVCAWMANPPAPREVSQAAQVHADERPNYVTLSDPDTLEWPHHSVTGALDPLPPDGGDSAALS